jgi:hypothetical protein
VKLLSNRIQKIKTGSYSPSLQLSPTRGERAERPCFWLAIEKIFLYNKETRRRSQVVRQESAKLPFSGPNPLVASNCFSKPVEIFAAKAVK